MDLFFKLVARLTPISDDFKSISAGNGAVRLVQLIVNVTDR